MRVRVVRVYRMPPSAQSDWKRTVAWCVIEKSVSLKCTAKPDADPNTHAPSPPLLAIAVSWTWQPKVSWPAHDIPGLKGASDTSAKQIKDALERSM